MPEDRIRLLSLNCWGLKFVSKNRRERIRAIANQLAHSNHDIVALQEVWVWADYQHIQSSVSRSLPHSKLFYSGALGSGLAIFSRFPIIGCSISPYSLNGAPIDVGGGDWFVGKAAASVIIDHPVLGQVQVFNTHLYAKGGEDGPEYNRAHRIVNAWEFSKLARQAAELGRYVIAMGDFNSVPTTLPIAIIREHAGLSDSWVVAHPDSLYVQPINSPQQAVEKFGVTADSPLNSYSAGKPLDPHARQYLGKRLDYIFYRQPRKSSHLPPQYFIRASKCQVAMLERVPGYRFSYSDHFGLEATLDIVATVPDDPETLVLGSAYDIAEAGRRKPTVEVDPVLSKQTIDTMVRALVSCHHFAQYRAKKELIGFGICIALLVGAIVSSVWVNHGWITPIIIVVTIFLAWLGTTLLYEGFIYGNWECNALMNVIEELDVHKSTLAD
ncbi:hypothetical protein M378DRAFT_188979 [Amanita muscaria Koide BX008]|uniref:Endonuclease/exonuclease/phosphatase domain-containing protein n=1 Tax=Amanita muscaria (strain Koide BX008) TaxID=946122 RepID=A0A0C2XAX9_AMAMK|nr:hypothetical protein M378DRAFT_188979 [Amanita muscaria Koide BX008]